MIFAQQIAVLKIRGSMVNILGFIIGFLLIDAGIILIALGLGTIYNILS